MTSPQIQKIREVCERLVEAREKAKQDEWKLSKWNSFEIYAGSGAWVVQTSGGEDEDKANMEFIALAANTSANLAKALLVAVASLERVPCRFEERFGEKCDDERGLCHRCEALEKIASQLTGEK